GRQQVLGVEKGDRVGGLGNAVQLAVPHGRGQRTIVEYAGVDHLGRSDPVGNVQHRATRRKQREVRVVEGDNVRRLARCESAQRLVDKVVEWQASPLDLDLVLRFVEVLCECRVEVV